MAVRRKHIRTLVQQMLSEHGIREAPVRPEKLAKALGVSVHKNDVDETLSGFLLRHPVTRKAIIGVNGKHHPNRQRFTVAHELGHLLLHEGPQLHVDLRHRDENSSKGDQVEEIEANEFAAELLMPASFLERDIEQLENKDLLDEDVLKPLADRYKVSVQALTFRLANLGLVSL